MHYRTETAKYVVESIENGWLVAYYFISKEDDDGAPAAPTLNVVLICNWRLDDGKVRFVKVDLTKDGAVDLIRLISDRVRYSWTIEIEQMRINALNNLST